MPMSNKRQLLRQTGFSLVEILVGLVIGLLVTIRPIRRPPPRSIMTAIRQHPISICFH